MLDLKELGLVPPKENMVQSCDLSTPRSANERIKDALLLPPIHELVGNIWLSNELHLLFADTGVGKSVEAVSIGDALSKGNRFLFLENKSEPQVVLFYDFELSDRQFLKRYSDESGALYIFSPNFYCDTIDFKQIVGNNPADFEKQLFQKIRTDVKNFGASVVIIDNITYLKTQTTQKTDSALELMRELTDLKREFNLSILVLAHTPKIDLTQPLTINSLAGSKHLSNFADSVSALGKSNLGSDIRYLKQIKVRNAEMLYDTNNVITCKLIKNGNFLTFDFLGFDRETNHLKTIESDGDKEHLISQATELKNAGKSYAEIAETLLGSKAKKGTIHKWLSKQPVSTVSTVSNPEPETMETLGNPKTGIC